MLVRGWLYEQACLSMSESTMAELVSESLSFSLNTACIAAVVDSMSGFRVAVDCGGEVAVVV